MFLAFLTISLNLRAPITALPPVITEVKNALSMTPAFAGILTTIPVLCFGLFTPFASKIIGKTGIENAIMLTLGDVLIGSVVRVLGGTGCMLAGTILIGLALTVGNLLELLVIARDYKSSAGMMTGIMVLGMSFGGMITSSLTVPIAHMFDWRWALAFWSLFALLSLILWIPGYRRESSKAKHAAAKPITSAKNRMSFKQFSPAKIRAVIALTLAFSAHSFAFYGIVAWLPTFLVQNAHFSNDKAGVIVSIFHLLGFVGCMGMPLLKKWFNLSIGWMFVIGGLTWFLVPTGFYLLPQHWLLWDIAGGIGCGSAFVIIFSLIIAKSASLEENRYTSSVVQSIGYIIASISPMITGWLYQISGHWRSSFTVLALATLIFMIGGLLANFFYKQSEQTPKTSAST
ncbi:CP family cyanate transporter-like MFS transporter [Neisseria perflava]|uniref:MFS transporter n=1 Tax=Neisseria perflava TaxID=33053 RepID=UPI0020A157DE|nr:MFS transporter [Neisseria perflava]MCP1771628.1 CP family cyanate transporter-like MFS transporter [Neisseria perflava]